MQEIDSRTERASEPFFSRLDWGAFWTAFAVSFVVYFYTLSPTVGLEDSGELAVAGDYLGVPHPPGYPIWTLISWLFARVFAFVRFRGQPNPAWSIGLVSAMFGAFAAGITSMLICRSGSDILSRSKQVSHNVSDSSRKLICWVGGVVGSLLFAFTPIMWSQAVIVEVYSLNAFFLVIVLLLIYVWTYRPSNRVLYATGFLFGLGLTNYQVLLLAALALAIIIMMKDFELFRDFAVVGGSIIAMIIGLSVLVKLGVMGKAVHAASPVVVTGIVLNAAILVAGGILLPRGRTASITVLMAELGLAFYIFMPIVSDLRNPPMNWAYPRTWEGFLHAVKRGQYEKIKPSDPLSLHFISQLGVYLGDLTLNYALVIALIGFLPFITYSFKIGERRIRCMEIAAVLVAVSFVLQFLLGDVVAVYKIPALLILIMVVFGALVMIVGNFRHVIEDHLTAKNARIWERVLVVLVLLAIAGAYISLLYNNLKITFAPLQNPKVTVTAAMKSGIAKQLAYSIFITASLIAGTIFAYWLSRRKAFEIVIDRDSQKWMTATQVAFVTLSIGLIALANLKMDIQDTFIQRVKFISSHALFSLWIGYGVIFLLAMLDGLKPRNRTLSLVSACVMLGLVGTPLWKNWKDERLVHLYGGAEQNGHDFGWQFGNYQLRGADSVTEELDPEEEPLPNPMFPPEMTQDAIFFGGTDPGRFVPTYMIYSARVREDVYLITQNALADNTYMNVMRDLYGDQIWIPAQQDSARAFQRYVREVKSGKRQPHADLKIENGRVQVSGALGVMEINGILAEMIFEHNNYKHDFYVEESYVIRWMYPYLTPHGLIMKINSKKTGLAADVIRDDMDFWDWYTRRLVSNPRFSRDVVARKSFSKLRSAIAGLYANRGKLRQAETAFKQARMLYALSPEANFRLVQEVLMRERRFDESKELMRAFGEQDPRNRRVPQFLGHLERIQGLDAKIHALESKRRKGSLDVKSAMDLADLYLQANQKNHFQAIMQGVIASSNMPPQFMYQAATKLHRAKSYSLMDKALQSVMRTLPANSPPEVFLNMAKMYAEAKRPDRMLPALQAYLRRKPDDWKAWLDFASVSIGLKQTNAAVIALEKARSLGGAEADAIIRKDKRFIPLLKPTTRPPPTKDLLNLPGMSPGTRRP